MDGDGAEDLDGVPLDGAALLKGAMKHGLTPQTTSNYDDIDGVPSKSVFQAFIESDLHLRIRYIWHIRFQWMTI